jgi:hypothetical protein
MLKHIALVVALPLVLCATTRELPTIDVCELIHQPSRWEGKIIAVKGVLMSPHDGVADMGVFLTPQQPCRYSNSKYVDADEPAEVMLDYPDGHFLARPPSGFRLEQSSLARASERLKQIHKRSPSTRPIVVVEAFVALRKYNLREVERDVKTHQQMRPIRTAPPVILTVQAYRSLAAK